MNKISYYIVMVILLLCLIFLSICIIDSKQVNTNKVVDCIDVGDNFIPGQKCYKRVFCGNKIKIFDSKYCDEKYRLSGKVEQ